MTSVSSESSVAEAAAPSTRPRICFGDLQPETVASNERRPTDLLTNGHELFWLSEFKIRRMDRASRNVTSLIATFKPAIRNAFARNLVAVDARDLFLLVAGPHAGAPELAAIDLTTGEARIVAEEPYASTTLPTGEPAASDPLSRAVAQAAANETFSQSDYALDPTYVYFAFYEPSLQHEHDMEHPDWMKGPHDLGFLARVRRDGLGTVEVLGPGPFSFFIASEGFAYWGSPFEGIKRRALVPGATNEMVWAAPDLRWPLLVDGGRLFFKTVHAGPPRSITIQSVPAGTLNASAADAGGVDVRTHVPSCQFKLGSGHRVFFDGKCVYSGSYLGLSRVDIDDGKEQELLSGPRNAVPASARDFVATDGRYLYWADYTRDRIVRWAR
jgi:hypothetical protein